CPTAPARTARIRRAPRGTSSTARVRSLVSSPRRCRTRSSRRWPGTGWRGRRTRATPIGRGSWRWRRVSDLDVVGFDVYVALFDITGEDWAAPEVVPAARSEQLQYSWLVSLMGAYRPFRDLTRAAVENALAVHGAHADVDSVMEAMLHIRPYPEMAAALESIARSARLAVLSNGDPESLEALLANAGVRDRFEWVISADEVRVYKPAPAVYQRLLDRTGAARE